MQAINKILIITLSYLSIHNSSLKADATSGIVGGLTLGIATGIAYDRSGMSFPLGWIAESIIRNMIVGAVTASSSYETKQAAHAAAEAATWLTWLALYKKEEPKVVIIWNSPENPQNNKNLTFKTVLREGTL